MMQRSRRAWRGAPKEQVLQLADVPDNDLLKVVEDFESEGAKVDVERQRDGAWTVTALMPTVHTKSAS